MLKFLHIENIAVIEKTDIDLSAGLTVLTGETGAGKSIVIDAINAVLGERTSKELIRSGCDKAEVSALFGELSDEVILRLSQLGFEPDENGELVINRVLSLSGNGSVRINGRPSTVGMLKSMGRLLVNIHGQHDNQSLLDPATHGAYLDRVAENGGLTDKYYAEFKYLNSVRRELAATETDEDEKRRRSELLNYQINELRSAEIKPGERAELKKQLDIAENAKKIRDTLDSADYLISGSAESDGAVSQIKNAVRLLEMLKVGELKEPVSKLTDALMTVEDACSQLRDFARNGVVANADTEKIRQRLDLLYDIVLKYGGTEEKAAEYLLDAEDELEKIILSDKRAEELGTELDHSAERLVALGEKLTDSRKKAAARLEKEVTELLHGLNMPDAAFCVSINKGRYTKTGCDEIEFCIKTNVGEAVKPLSKVASGGELSRVMLAIKSALADKDEVQTLIFDEIDSGISGRTADKVGKQLLNVASGRQVLCVTHLAQIAAYADRHFCINKSVRDGRTYTSVTPLDYEERIDEIARIMSGTEMTENLYNSAKELLDRRYNNANL